MRIFVKAHPAAKIEKVERIDNVHFEVFVKAPPVGGKANEAILKELAGYFGIAASRLRIVAGHAAKQKIIEII